jgi:single-stranded-DNA-specific exonuclease
MGKILQTARKWDLMKEKSMRIIPPLVLDSSTETSAKQFANEMSAPSFVSKLLMDRGVNNKEEAKAFFLAEWEEAFEESSFLGMSKGLELLRNIQEQKQVILIHGDYDVDGVAGAALLYQALQHFGFEVRWYLPNRFKDGYGLSIQNVERFHNEGVEWILTVDTGVSAVAEIQRAKELGMGVIVTDHHQMGEDIPNADVIINPNQRDCSYPNKGLSGTGVAWRLVDCYAQKYCNSHAQDFLDLVALASLADMMPMMGENRHLVRKGLRILQETEHPGLRALLDTSGLYKKSLSSSDILFRITPLLNAAGRLQGPDLSFQLLSAKTHEEAKHVMKQILEINERRKKLDRKAYQEAVTEIDTYHNPREKSCIVIASSNWNEGIIGIVAAKVVERYYRPTFVMSIENGIAKGSARTVEGFNLHKALATCSDLLERWGGHYYACGFSIREEYIPELKKRLNALAQEHLTDKAMIPEVRPHVLTELRDINEDALTWIKRFEPSGPSNELPLFYSRRVYLAEPGRVVGGEHLKCTFVQEGISIPAIGFGLGGALGRLEEGEPLEIAFYPEWNHFHGKSTIQLRLVAVHQEKS